MAQITRRAALSQGALAALCVPAIAAAVPAGRGNLAPIAADHPDAALIGLCTEFLALDERIQAWDEARIELAQPESDALCVKHGRYIRPIADAPARTPAGRQIKLRAALAVMRNADEIESLDRDDLVRAALREAITDDPIPTAPNPDAELVAASAEVERLETEASAALRGAKSIEEEDAKQAVAATIQARQQLFIDTIATVPSWTMLGTQAKARALAAWAPDMLKAHHGTNDERMLASLLADLTGRAEA